MKVLFTFFPLCIYKSKYYFVTEVNLINIQILSDVRKMMEQLPILQREVVYMRYYQQLTFKEIAEATGVSINTSLGRMRYALLNLRRMAKKHDVYLQLD